MKKSFLIGGAAVLALAGAGGIFALTAADQREASVSLDDAVNVSRIRNAEGRFTQIVSINDRAFETASAARPPVPRIERIFPGWRVVFGGDTRPADFSARIDQHLQARGLPRAALGAVHRTLHHEYGPLSGYDAQSSRPMYRAPIMGLPIGARGEVGPVAYSYGTGSQAILRGESTMPTYCVVAHLSTSFNGAAWTRSFLDLPDNRRVVLAREFGPEFSQFSRYHEWAHCAGGREAQADLTAAVMLLKKHPDSAQAVAFLEHYRDIRRVSSLHGARGIYDGTAAAVDEALLMYRRGGNTIRIPEGDIWALARLRLAPVDTATIAAVRAQFGNAHPEFAHARNYDAMTAFVARLAADAAPGRRKETLTTLHASLTRLMGVIPVARAPNSHGIS